MYLKQKYSWSGKCRSVCLTPGNLLIYNLFLKWIFVPGVVRGGGGQRGMRGCVGDQLCRLAREFKKFSFWFISCPLSRVTLSSVSWHSLSPCKAQEGLVPISIVPQEALPERTRSPLCSLHLASDSVVCQIHPVFFFFKVLKRTSRNHCVTHWQCLFYGTSYLVFC